MAPTVKRSLRLPMHLHAFIPLTVALLLASASGVHAHSVARAPDTPAPPAASPSCKAVPGTPDWPAPSAWAQLNESTGGRLFQPAPPGAVCHPGQPTYDAAECAAVQSNWSTQYFHQANPISSMWQEWNNDSCLPYPSDPCSGEGYPVYVINATTVQHVKAGVDFARQHNVRLIVKSSGHDYVGRSSAPNSLSIWVHHMKGTELHDTFTPKGCPCSVKYNTSITAAGGSQMIDLYEATAAVGQTSLGGGGEGVAVGGYLTGGGHSPLSARYGLAADQVLEMEIVTPQGEILTLNECQNTDLFWAMRGGGGSTFGVLTSVTVKTYPSPSMVNMYWSLGTPDYTNPAFYDMVAYVISQYPALGDAGVAGYSYWVPLTPYSIGNTTVNVAVMFGDVFVLDTQDPDDITSLFDPIWEHINTTWPGLFTIIPPTVTTFASFIDWYDVHYDMSSAGGDTAVGSRLLSKEALTANLTAAAAAYKQFAASGAGTAYLVSGKGVFDAKPPGGGDSVCPAWRTSYVHATTGAAFPPLNATAKADAWALVNYAVEALRELDPGSGAYVNEADPYEPNWQTTFWGDNYPRLLEIKRAVDPDDVLWCLPCVGNERWQEVGNMLCRV